MVSSMARSRFEKVACFNWCFTFNSRSLGYIFLKNDRSSDLSFIPNRSSINLDVP